uniref:Uncharacterized protein n=1 Tax=Rhizophagus irregularis (strain DAOM 181602 / DAOM 197198 / MUCL 43194) TaxID=747089 RepID=U9UDB1_RHIID
MAINISLSLNSYKPKRWTYITFKLQQMMDTTMEQSIALQECFNIGQSNNNNSSTNRSRQRSCSQSKDHSNSQQRNNLANYTERTNNNISNTSLPKSTNSADLNQSA